MSENADKYFKELQTARDKRMKKLFVREQNELIKIYDKAFRDSYNDLCNSRDIGESQAVQNAKAAYTKQLYNELNRLCMKYNKAASKEATKNMADFTNNIYSDYSKDKLDEINKNANIVNKWAVDQIVKGSIYKDGKSLDKRIWDVSNNAGKQIHDAIASMIAQGKGAAEMSQILKEFGLGGHRTWDRNKIKEKLGPGYARSYGRGLDYEALRLARTTLNHASQLATMNLDKINPYAGAIRWRSDHTNGKTCDLCISRATGDHEGLGPGIYLLQHVPFDHPNGYCHAENVFIMNGKVVSPTEMANDIGKWIRGEKNSGMMDKLYGNIPVDPQWIPKKVTKVTKNVNNNSKPAKPKPVKISDDDVRDGIHGYFANNKAADTDLKKRYFRDSRPILNKYPRHYLDAMGDTIDMIDDLTTRKGKGCYWRGGNARELQLDIDDIWSVSRRTRKDKYNTMFHELGHAMDSEITPGKILSRNKDFIRAMKHDYDKHFDIMIKKFAEEKGVDPSKYKDTPSNRRALYERYLIPNNKTSGIQDVVGGISGENLAWGHDQSYWDRRNRDEEVASELWAHLVGSRSGDETYELMNTYFPTAMKMQDKIIKDEMVKKGYVY